MSLFEEQTPKGLVRHIGHTSLTFMNPKKPADVSCSISDKLFLASYLIKFTQYICSPGLFINLKIMFHLFLQRFKLQYLILKAIVFFFLVVGQ